MYTILCIDDTPANLLVLEALFEDYTNKYKIITLNGGYEALELLLKEKVDLILLDVMMPEIDGFETAQLIKTNKFTKDIPIIFLTAKRDNETIKKSFQFGVDYLSKPYDEFELMSRVTFHLELLQANRKLEEQINFNQSVLDSQRNIILIHSEQGIQSVNKSFLDFFNVDSLDEFLEQNKCISELFMEYENYFSLEVLNDGRIWTNSIYKHQDIEYNVLIMDTKIFEPCAFKIDVNEIKDSEKFVVTLTDITKLTTKSKQFEAKATYDALTGVYNRSKFNDVFESDVKISLKNNTPLCFAIMDIDFFKKVNDNYGHIIGDETLITFATTIQNKIEKKYTFARWGGEEFVLSLPNCDIESAFKIVDNLRKEIENTLFKVIGSITCSIGLTQLVKDDTIDNILIRSDEALYEAKESGRNKVCVK